MKLPRVVAVNRLEGIVKDIVGHRYARRLAVIARRAEVNTGKDTGIRDFIERRRKASKRTDYPE